MKREIKPDFLAAGLQAGGYFTGGFHCAEAVATAVLECLGEDSQEAAAHASAFGGGCGRTFDELCGALSGGLIAIGHLYGRRVPGGDWDRPAYLGAQIRQRFIDVFATTHCGTLRERFGTEKQSDECQQVVCRVTTALLDIITEPPASHPDF